ncbi:MAG: hypothetical protein A2W80_00210 [Candidatus Riflebacteria bacterium GWC2_50_8]|nr:MAG: hypothetical protein A2W80_00210 [Candidatus Riflebacteria bacterium GWC2_50_8]
MNDLIAQIAHQIVQSVLTDRLRTENPDVTNTKAQEKTLIAKTSEAARAPEIMLSAKAIEAARARETVLSAPLNGLAVNRRFGRRSLIGKNARRSRLSGLLSIATAIVNR